MKPTLCIVGVLLAVPFAAADISLIGTASIPGTALDKSGLTETVCDGIPHNRLGSFGSAIEYSGSDNLYYACNDRGPANGECNFRCRFHTFRIVFNTQAAASESAVSVDLVSTTLLSDQTGRPLTGAASAFDALDQSRGLRYDAEAIRLSGTHTLFISDEYGPWIDEYSTEGRRLRRLSIPSKFLIEHPSAHADKELPPHNLSGRQSNRGFEGLAISPDGSTLWAMLQSPLIQDGALSPANKRIGTNLRILEIKPATGATREFVYTLDSPAHGVNELLAINDHQMLVLERDGKGGKDAHSRALFRIDITDATDASAIPSLPTKGLPEGVKAVRKSKFLDFTDPRFGLRGETMPEKIEGLAFGPDLPDGRRSLVVTSDNDLLADHPSWFWVFAIDKADLADQPPAATPAAAAMPPGNTGTR